MVTGGRGEGGDSGGQQQRQNVFIHEGILQREMSEMTNFRWRGCVQGKGEFSMEYQQHAPVTADIQAKLAADHKSTARN
jgi:hypothetical protein